MGRSSGTCTGIPPRRLQIRLAPTGASGPAGINNSCEDCPRSMKRCSCTRCNAAPYMKVARSRFFSSWLAGKQMSIPFNGARKCTGGPCRVFRKNKNCKAKATAAHKVGCVQISVVFLAVLRRFDGSRSPVEHGDGRNARMVYKDAWASLALYWDC